jgi:hypothetical protein
MLIAFVLIGVSAWVIASVQNASPPPSMLKLTLTVFCSAVAGIFSVKKYADTLNNVLKCKGKS